MKILENTIILKIIAFLTLGLFWQNNYSQEPEDFCKSASLFCSFNNYHGVTSHSYTDYASATDPTPENTLPLGDVFCGSIENNSWFRFAAVDTLIILDVTTYNCSGGQGIQMEVYETSDCYNFVSLSNCEDSGSQTDFQITATNLIPGNLYYIMVDGQSGDVCEYLINGIAGFPDTYTLSADTVCLGDTASLYASGGLEYHWYPNEGISDPDISNPNVIIWDTITYMVEVYGSVPLCLLDIDTVTLYPDYCGTCVAHAGFSDTCCAIIYSGLNASYLPEFSYTEWSCSDTLVHFENAELYNTLVTADDTGTYQLIWTVADSLGEFCSDTIYITFSGNLSMVTSGENESSYGACDGQATVTASGGTPPYIYNWSSTSIGLPTIYDLCSDTYEVTVTDATGCELFGEITISYPEQAGMDENGDIKMYPNPFQDNLILENNSEIPVTISIKDITGITKYESLINPGKNEIALSMISKGIYIISINDRGKITKRKIIKQ